jgi:membrane associated rhomboid family serine protease
MNQTSFRPSLQQVFPPVIKNLLILNGLVFLAQIVPATNQLLVSWFALWPIGAPFSNVPSFWPWQLVTYGFLHGGFGHILFNMFALWMFGIQIENTWGSRRFGIYYFVCVIGAGLVQLVVATLAAQGGDVYPTLGASGGVFGILLAFGMMFPDQEIYLYFLGCAGGGSPGRLPRDVEAGRDRVRRTPWMRCSRPSAGSTRKATSRASSAPR